MDVLTNLYFSFVGSQYTAYLLSTANDPLISMIVNNGIIGLVQWAQHNTGSRMHRDGPLRVLHELYVQEAKDSHDKIYGFLGLF